MTRDRTAYMREYRRTHQEYYAEYRRTHKRRKAITDNIYHQAHIEEYRARARAYRAARKEKTA